MEQLTTTQHEQLMKGTVHHRIHGKTWKEQLTNRTAYHSKIHGETSNNQLINGADLEQSTDVKKHGRSQKQNSNNETVNQMSQNGSQDNIEKVNLLSDNISDGRIVPIKATYGGFSFGKDKH